jgi:hypothetical protein
MRGCVPYETRCEGLCWTVDLVLPACQDIPSCVVGHGDEREHESEVKVKPNQMLSHTWPATSVAEVSLLFSCLSAGLVTLPTVSTRSQMLTDESVHSSHHQISLSRPHKPVAKQVSYSAQIITHCHNSQNNTSSLPKETHGSITTNPRTDMLCSD